MIENQKKTLQELALEYVSMGNQALAMDDGGVVEEGSVPYGKRLDDIAIRSALANYNKALRIVPDCIDAMIGKARLLMALDQLDSAEKELEKALELDKNNFSAHFIMGELMQQLHDVPEAIKCYKKAAKADKKRPEPHEKLKDIFEKIGLDDLAEEEQEIAKRLRRAIYKAKSNPKRKRR